MDGDQYVCQIYGYVSAADSLEKDVETVPQSQNDVV
jgi:hypothetical protein